MEKLIPASTTHYMSNNEIKENIQSASARIIATAMVIQNSEFVFFEDSAFEELEKEALLIKKMKRYIDQPF